MPWQSLGLGRLHTAEKCTPASVRQETLTVSANCKSTAPLCMSGPSKVVFPFLPSKSKKLLLYLQTVHCIGQNYTSKCKNQNIKTKWHGCIESVYIYVLKVIRTHHSHNV